MASYTPEQSESIKVAVEGVTSWMSFAEGPRTEGIEHILEITEYPNDKAGQMIIGLLNLSVALLVRLAKAEGAATASGVFQRCPEILQEISLEVET